MNRLIVSTIAAVLIVSSLLSAVAVDWIEVRSPAVKTLNGTSEPFDSLRLWGTDEPQSKFSGFYYDIDDNLGTESITLNVNEVGVLDGSSEPKGIIYKTQAQDKPFKFEGWGNYRSIGFLGENYLAGYSSADIVDSYPYLYKNSEDPNVLDKEKLLKVLIDDDEDIVVPSGNKVPLNGGYEIEINGVDINGNTVYLRLLKDGQVVGESTITPSDEVQNIKDSTYCFAKDVADIKKITLVAVHFKNAFTSADREVTTIDGIFQVSDVPVNVASNTEYGKMTVSNVGSDEIVLDNEDNSITLASDIDKEIMTGLFIRTADQVATVEDPIRYYIYKKIIEPGTYEVRGEIKDAVSGADISWDARGFPGFYYDLNNDLGGESLQLSLSADPKDDNSEPAQAVYRTVAEECEFDLEEWQKYYAIGFLGEKCFAGYVKNVADQQGNSKLFTESTDTNLMDDEIVSPILIDDDEEHQPLGVGSVIELEEGYELNLISIDVNGNSVLVKLSKDGKDVEQERILDLDEEKDYCYKTKLGSSEEIVTIAVHFINAFTSNEANLATVKGIWQISDAPISIADGRKIGEMTIQEVNSGAGDMSIEMDNEDGTVKIGSDRDVPFMGDFYIKTSDLKDRPSDTPLRLYVYRKETIGTGDAETVPPEVKPNPEVIEAPYGGSKETSVRDDSNTSKGTPGFSSLAALVSLLAVLFARRSEH